MESATEARRGPIVRSGGDHVKLHRQTTSVGTLTLVAVAGRSTLKFLRNTAG